MSVLLLRLFFVFVFLFSLIFASWYQVNGDIIFTADIARDFHLFREINEKGLVLIGPRSSTGLFHGPTWTYLNYPAFLIGSGDPIIVGWFWIGLAVAFVVSNYFIARDLFSKLSALFFSGATAVYMGYHTNGLFNPHGAMFFIPVYFWLFIKYLREKKLIFLALHLITGGVILQFQLALGVPLLALSTLYLLFLILRKGERKHLLAFLLLPLLVGNFILFDIRHEGVYRDKLFGFVQPEERGEIYNYFSLINDRLSSAFNGTEILRHDAYGYLNLIFFLTVLILCVYFIRQKKHRDVYAAFLYFYFGFFLLSFINKGPILYFYIFPLFPLVFLMMASFLDTKLKNYLVIPLMMILLINISNGIRDMKDAFHNTIGKTEHSWKSMKNITEPIFKNNQEFGYFVYSPDSFAYQGRYTTLYLSDKYGTGEHFTKKPITYIIAAPTPENEFITGDEWWTKNKVRIMSEPTEVIRFDNGYKTEKYELTEEELTNGFDTTIDAGLTFR